jgi:hypothetical protein
VRILVFGAGELAREFALHRPAGQYDMLTLLARGACDAAYKNDVLRAIRINRPDFVINTAGKSDLTGVSAGQVWRDNYRTVDTVAWACGSIPSLHLISTAAFGSIHHPFYGPAKAAALGVVRHRALLGRPIWALSPNRMNTRMRQADWPFEDPRTRLDPATEVVPVMQEIIDGLYAPGAHVVLRKVGVPGRVDKFEAVNPYEHLPSML